MSAPRPSLDRVVLVHAMNSTLDDHWYRWLCQHLDSRGVSVVAPAMPTPFTPDRDAWQATLEEAVGAVDASTAVVAHSVGNAAAIRFLASQPEGWRLGALVNVGGFGEPQPGNPWTVPFTEGLTFDVVRDSTLRREAFIGADDPEVPRALSERLAADLASTVHLVEGAGHFRDEDGYTEFPALDELLDELGVRG